VEEEHVLTVEELVDWVWDNRARVTMCYWPATHSVKVEVAIPPPGRTHAESDHLLPGEHDEVGQLMAKVAKRVHG
jgi:hypothetical protein